MSEYVSKFFSSGDNLKVGKSNPELKAVKKSNRKNFASKDSGATIQWKSDGIQNPKAILSGNKEEYLILPECTGNKDYTLIINLSEYVSVDTIIVSNHEEFSDILSSISF